MTEVNKLERTAEGRPILNLVPLKRTAVHTPTQEEYDTLMQVYESGELKWCGGKSPTSLKMWGAYEKKTSISAEFDKKKKSFRFCNEFYYDEGLKVFTGEGYNSISTQDFYKIQKINSEMLKEINKWFDRN